MPALCLCRHGQTDFNVSGQIQGQLDEPLNPVGVRQAHELARRLRTEGLQVLLSSDLKRAVHTARIVAQALKLPIALDRGLREADFGQAQGLTRAEAWRRFGPETHARWRSREPGDLDVAYPGGETGAQVLARSHKAIRLFVQSQPGWQRIGVVTHGGVIRRLLDALSPLDLPAFKIANATPFWLTCGRRTGLFTYTAAGIALDPGPGQ